MINIFDYSYFRKYLKDYYEERKSAVSSFSYKSFANKAGFKDKGFLHSVIKGLKNLSKSSIIRISRAIGHNKYEAEYFENLVFLNQAVDLEDRNHFYKKLQAINTKEIKKSKVQQLHKGQFEFYSKWYHSAVRSLIDMYPFKGDYKCLAKKVFPNITPKQAKKSVGLLEELGLIKKQKDGIYKIADKNISTGNDIVNLAVRNFHKDTTQLAANAITQLPKKRRNISGLTVGISDKAYKQICDEINSFRSRVVKIVDNDENSDSVYRLNIHLFPFSNNKK